MVDSIPRMDDLIADLKRHGDQRQYNWEEIRQYCQNGEYVQIMRKLRNMQDDDDFGTAFRIVARYVAFDKP